MKKIHICTNLLILPLFRFSVFFFSFCSDTALYCPERWQERRQSVDVHGGLHLQAQLSTDSNPEEEAFMSGGFLQGRPPSFQASSSYSSFSVASDEKGEAQDPGSTLSSSHQGLYIDWRDDYEHKSTSSYDKDTSPAMTKTASPSRSASRTWLRPGAPRQVPEAASSPRRHTPGQLPVTASLTTPLPPLA